MGSAERAVAECKAALGERAVDPQVKPTFHDIIKMAARDFARANAIVMPGDLNPTGGKRWVRLPQR